MALPIKPCAPRPCKECPFRKNSAPGWLGPWPDAATLHLHIVAERDFACHMTMGDDDEDELPEDTRRCTGAIMYATKSAKRFVDPVLRKEQQEHQPTEEIMNLFEFKEHHTRNR